MPSAKKPLPKARKGATCHPDLESVLFTDKEIKGRVVSLGRELKEVYGDGEFTIISIINGAMMFTSDLMRQIQAQLGRLALARKYLPHIHVSKRKEYRASITRALARLEYASVSLGLSASARS